MTHDQLVASIIDELPLPRPPEEYASSLVLVLVAQFAMIGAYVVIMALFLRLCFFDIPNRGLFILSWLAPSLGVIVLVSMIKSLVAARSTRTPPVELAPELHPLIYRYVYRLCDKLQAPRPRSICVDCEPNASASFRNGIYSIASNDLVLTIGLPLAGSLSLRQLTGVIAHELGHFNQKTGMRVPILATTINSMIHRIVYDRDAFDQLLHEWSQTSGIVAWILKAISAFLWLNRGMLWLLMMVNLSMTARLLRVMEFDADQYETMICGSKEFAQTSQTLTLLGAGAARAHERVASFALEKRLPDNLPSLIQSETQNLPTDQKREILAADGSRRARWYESHPSSAERIAAASNPQREPTLTLRAKATVLFPDFASLCTEATSRFYSERAPFLLQMAQVTPTAAILQEAAKDDEAAKAVERYFQGAYEVRRPILPKGEVDVPMTDRSGDLARLKTVRGKMVPLASQAWGLNRKYIDALAEAAVATLAKEALERHVPIPPGPFGLREANVADATRALGDAQTQIQQIDTELKKFESAARERLELGLRFFFDNHTVAATPGSRIEAERKEVLRMLAVARAMEKLIPLSLDIYRRVSCIAVFVRAVDRANPHPGVVNLVVHQSEVLVNQIMKIADSLKRVEYPFEGAGVTNVGDYLVTYFPASNDIESVLTTANAAADRFGLLLHRVTSRLTHAAETAESATGLPQLSDASAESDPLAVLYAEVAADKQKKADAEAEASMKKAMIWGPESRAATAAFCMVAILVWFSVARTITPRRYAYGPPGPVPAFTPSAAPMNRMPPPPNVSTPSTLEPRPPAAEPRIEQVSPLLPGSPAAQQAPSSPYPPNRSPRVHSPRSSPGFAPMPKDAQPQDHETPTAAGDYSPNSRVRYELSGAIYDGIIIGAASDGRFTIGYVIVDSINGHKTRTYTTATRDSLKPFGPGNLTAADGIAVPKFIPGDPVLLRGVSGYDRSQPSRAIVERIITRGSMPPIYLIAGSVEGRTTRTQSMEDQLILSQP